MRKYLSMLALLSVLMIGFSGCLKAPPAEGPEETEKKEDVTKMEEPVVYENKEYGFKVTLPADWGEVRGQVMPGDQFVLASKTDLDKEILINTIETRLKSSLGESEDIMWIGENEKYAFYYLTSGLTQEEVNEMDQLLENFETMAPVELTIKEKIEDGDSYKGAGPDFSLGMTPCRDYPEGDEFIEKVEEGRIQARALYSSENYNLWVYMTPNYENWDTEEFKKINDYCGELGSNFALKAVDDYLIWGYAHCTAGVIPPEDSPGYDDYLKCMEVEKELTEYLEVDDDIGDYECPEEGVSINCEPVALEAGEEMSKEDKERLDYCEWVQENCEGVGLAL